MMGVSNSKPSLLLLWLLLTVTVSLSLRPTIAEGRTLPFSVLPQLEKYSKTFATLGLVCKCCDGTSEAECTTTWEGSCSKLQCHPWKIG